MSQLLCFLLTFGTALLFHFIEEYVGVLIGRNCEHMKSTPGKMRYPSKGVWLGSENEYVVYIAWDT